jgi:predicted ATP-grasp superfamily ATP-dependent carboligase
LRSVRRGGRDPKAASACVDAGNISKAIEISLDVEQLIYEVRAFLNAMSLMRRIHKT